VSFHLPLLHKLVEERVGERRFLFRWEFIERLAAGREGLSTAFIV